MRYLGTLAIAFVLLTSCAPRIGLDATNAKLDAVSDRLSETNDRLSRMEALLRETNAALRQTNHAIAQTNENLDELSVSMRFMRADLDAMTKKLVHAKLLF